MGPALRPSVRPSDPTIDDDDDDDDDDDIRLELRERAKNSHDKSGNCDTKARWAAPRARAWRRNCDVNDSQADGRARDVSSSSCTPCCLFDRSSLGRSLWFGSLRIDIAAMTS